jgi:large subunit ribosomal protein L13
MKKIVIDATNATLGRLASYSAKQALLGKEIAIVNCDKAVIAGKRRSIIIEYQEKRGKGGI